MAFLLRLASAFLVAGLVKAANVTVPVTDDNQYLYSWTPGGKPPTDSASGLLTDCNPALPIIGQDPGQYVTFTFQGTQAWITLYTDGSGGLAQLLLDGVSVSNVTTVNNPPAAWFSVCSAFVAGTPVKPYGQYKFVMSASGGPVYWGPMIYDNTVPPSTTSTTSSTFTTTSTSSTSTPSTSLPPSPTSNHIGAIAGGAAAGAVFLLLACLGFLLWRRRVRPRNNHTVVAPDDDSDDDEAEVEMDPATLEARQATPWRPPDMTEGASAAVLTPLLPSSTSSTVDRKRHTDQSLVSADASQTSAAPRASLSHADIIRNLMSRNVPPEELSVAIRLLAAESPDAAGTSASSGPIATGEPPPTYEPTGTRS